LQNQLGKSKHEIFIKALEVQTNDSAKDGVFTFTEKKCVGELLETSTIKNFV
jgi:hypothetical protein